MAGLSPMIKGMVAVVLFIFAILMFTQQILTVNNPDSEVLKQSSFMNKTLASANKTITDAQNDVNTAKAYLEADAPSAVYVFLIIGSAFQIPKLFLGLIFNGINTILTFFSSAIFGIGASPFYIVLAVIGMSLAITVILLIVKMIRTGESER